MSPEKPRRLGRGLEALIGGNSPRRAELASEPAHQNELRRLALTRIRPNPYQPRREFSETDLAELRASLQASGMLQPVVVRPTGESFELISGERRFRAATQLGWSEIPALVRDADERTMLTLALIENLQRTDLNAVEEARGYQRLQEEFQLTHQEISEAVGKERSTITNLLRVLTLPDDVQTLLEQGQLTIGHAKALLALATHRQIAQLAVEIVADGLSVRATERRVRTIAGAGSQTSASSNLPQAAPTSSINPAPEIRHIRDSLRRRFQTDINIQIGANSKGEIRISFYSAEDFNRLIDLLNGPPVVGD